jgi:hypothetical protein
MRDYPRCCTLLTLCALLLGACATSRPAAPDRSPSGTDGKAGAAPQALDYARASARELERLPLSAVQSPDGAFSSMAEAAKAPSFSKQQALSVLQIPIGTEMPVQCHIYSDRIDAAGSLGAVVRSISEAMQIHTVRPVEIAASGGHAVLFVELEYLATVDGKKVMGLLKLATLPRDDVSFMCMHDEPGYRETFRRMVKGFAEGLVTKAATKARFRDVQIVRFNDAPVGFSEHAVFAEDGREVNEGYSSLFVPRSPSEVLASDVFTRESLDRAGQLVDMVYVKVVNGEVESKVSLARAQKDYAYQGTWEHKPLEGRFASKRPLVGDLQHWKLLRENVLGGKSGELALTSYSPTTDPTAPVEIIYRKRDGEPRGVTVEMGPMKLKGRADAHGVLERVELAAGRITIVSERLWSQGVP